MELHALPKTTARKKKRVGRGYGSGKGGHTSGRGQKGQLSRSKVPLYFEGTAMRKSLIRRLPMRRGKLRFKSHKPQPIVINLKYLNLLPKNTVVDLDTLIKHRFVKEKEARLCGVKILGDGQLKKPLTVKLPTSKSAAEKIKKAGGQVVAPQPAARQSKKTAAKARKAQAAKTKTAAKAKKEANKTKTAATKKTQSKNKK